MQALKEALIDCCLPNFYRWFGISKVKSSAVSAFRSLRPRGGRERDASDMQSFVSSMGVGPLMPPTTLSACLHQTIGTPLHTAASAVAGPGVGMAAACGGNINSGSGASTSMQANSPGGSGGSLSMSQSAGGPSVYVQQSCISSSSTPPTCADAMSERFSLEALTELTGWMLELLEAVMKDMPACGWLDQWTELARRFAFQHNPALQLRSVIVYGCICKSVSDSEIKQLLRVMMKSLEAYARELDVDKESRQKQAGANCSGILLTSGSALHSAAQQQIENLSAQAHLMMIDAVVRALTMLVPLLPAESILYKVILHRASI